MTTIIQDLPQESSTSPDRGNRLVRVRGWDQLDQGVIQAWSEFSLHRAQVPIQLTPEYVGAELDASGEAAPLKTQVVTCEDQGQIQGLAVLASKSATWRSITRPAPLWDLHGYRLAGNQLIHQHDDSNGVLQMVEGMAKELIRSQAAFLLIEDLETGTEFESALRQLQSQGFSLFWQTAPQPRRRIRFPGSAEEYWASFSSKSRYNLRRQDRKLEGTELVRVTQPDQVPGFLQSAHEISKQTWQAERLGLRVKNDATEQRFYQALATQGRLESYLLLKDKQPIAFLIGVRDRHTFYYEEIGYDRAWGTFSPGTVLLFKVINDLYARGVPEWMDFGFGDAPYKRLFANHETLSGKAWLFPPGWKSCALQRYVGAVSRGRSVLKQILSGIGWWNRLRQSVRRGSTVSTTPAVTESTPEHESE